MLDGGRGRDGGPTASGRCCSPSRPQTGCTTRARWAPGSPPPRLQDLQRRLEPLATNLSPLGDDVPKADARGARWVRPELVGEVRFTEWTRDGRLRHPAWRGLRPDKNAEQVVRET